MARRGAGTLRSGGGDRRSASKEWRRAVEQARTGDEPAWQPEVWVSEGPVRDEATRAVARGGRPADGDGRRGGAAARRPDAATTRGAPRKAPSRDDDADEAPVAAAAVADPQRELARAVGPQRAVRLETRLRHAADAFEAERFLEARSVLRPLADQAPHAPSVRELYGLTLYRLGRWRDAARELEAFRDMTGSTEQHPVLADCYRALGRHALVDELWEELGAASPSAALVAEGRIVAAGSLADRGDLQGAIQLLERGVKQVKRPRDHHLRLWYALARHYEDAGEVPRARELLLRVAEASPDFADAAARLTALGA